MHLVYKKINECLEDRKSIVVVTLIEIQGEAPGALGSKMVVSERGLEVGTVGGGKIEAAAIRYASQRIEKLTTTLETQVWNLQTDIGMTCGGKVTLLFESHLTSAWPIVVVGAGHLAQSLVPLLCTLECNVTCFDPRQEWREKFIPNHRLAVEDMTEWNRYLMAAKENTFFLVMTQGHATDLPVLESIFKRFPRPAYVGVIGSEIKALKIRAELHEKGFSSELIAKLRCPMGLRLGSNTPAEIAISIAGEILQVRDHYAKLELVY